MARVPSRRQSAFKSRLWMLPVWVLLGVFSLHARAAQPIDVLAAASLADALTEIGQAYQAGHGTAVRNSFASSAALAKQIENGAPADLFISANGQWMDYLQQRSLVRAETRRDLLTNRLVLIAPKGKAPAVTFERGFDLARAFDGRLCTGDVESVPAGIYAARALRALGWWQDLHARIVGARDVRAALTFVERGECALGIVYETDARASTRVEVVGVFPPETHDPVVYPVALSRSAGTEAETFLRYLQSDDAAAVFRRRGFTPVR